MLISFLRGELNVVQFLTDMLLSLPGIILALSLHEAAHGYVALRCGDPTAKNMGRLTLNPLKHLDLTGFISMIVVGIGWAKPVPVNPANFKNPRRDDILVSMAGITANLLQFLLACIIMAIFVSCAIAAVPAKNYMANGYFSVASASGEFYWLKSEAYLYAAGAGREYFIEPLLGKTAGYIFEVVIDYGVMNIALAAFNLLPIPPLDGYHLFNDLLLKRQLFAPAKLQRIGQAAVLLLAMTGLLSKGISFVVNGAFRAMGMLFGALLA